MKKIDKSKYLFFIKKQIPVNVNYDNPVLAALLGVAVGDALGVPVEFKSREYLDKNKVTTMIGINN